MWHEQFTHPLFATIAELLRTFSRFPDLDAMNRFASARRSTSMTFVAQDNSPQAFSDHYEPRIYLQHEVQTREHNWHDFFNFCVWNTFPTLKTTMNAGQYHALKQREAQHSRRSQCENVLTLLDENGAIVTSSDATLLALLRQHRWHELFYERRVDVLTHMRLYIVGHALFEKGLAPYKSMTASCLLMSVAPSFYQQEYDQQIKTLDKYAAHALNDLSQPKQLQPLPLLGFPGWSEEQTADFYADSQVFRPQRRGSTVYEVAIPSS